ncbi:aldo/keto reductase [Escherichia coli]
MLRKAFDLGITHFDLANNYGPPPGSAEENFGRLLPGGFCRLSRRTDYLYQGWLRYAARPLRLWRFT